MTGWTVRGPVWRPTATRALQTFLGQPRELPLSLVGMLGLYLFSSPVLSLLHQAIFVCVALALRTAAAPQFITGVLTWLGFDPIYASVIDHSVGNIQIKGLAIAGPLGDALYQLAPAVIAPSDQVAPGAWASAVVDDGASLLASVLAAVAAETAFVAAGLALISYGFLSYRALRISRFRAMTVLGLLLQVRGVVGLLGIGLTFDEIEAMGLSQVFTKLVPLDEQSYRSLVVEPLRTTGAFLIPMGLILAIYTPIAGLGLVAIHRPRRGAVAAWRRVREILGRAPDLLGGASTGRKIHALRLALAIVLTVLLAERLFPVQASFERPVVEIASPAPSSDGRATAVVAATPTLTPTPVVPEEPSKVIITGGSHSYRLTINGRWDRLRGVGYNSLYGDLSSEERAARYDQDFARMRAAGLNTILAWSTQQFDELTLTRANQYGVGVVMPYRLPSDGSYADPVYRQQTEDAVLRWVQRYRSFPALRMWGIGNEVIHGMGKNPETPQSKAFAEFYVQLADKVHALDPDHPVTYRGAEDVYIKPMKQALLNDPRPRPWFVYGVNFFTFRICDALRDWPRKGVDVPLMVSEFAPAGFGRDDRPNGYVRMWRCILENPDNVLGGFAYVWNTKGPEALDRSFGLMTPEDLPADNSLAVLGDQYRADRDTNR